MSGKPRDCRARVVAVRALAPDILEADLRVEDPVALEFDAGQWISVRLGPKTVRAYSIASAPRSGSVITLCADVVPGGVGSQWFRGLEPGSPVEFKGPLGGFVFTRADPRRPFFVAEEIGIVPIRAILADLYETGFGREAALVSWARDPGWLVYHGELNSLARRYPGFAYHPVVERPADGWAGETGSLIEAVERHAPPSEGHVGYVAGGEKTIHAVRDLLVGRGMERKAVKWEKFW
ncbi:MAG: SIP domain-containing protein [Candidatus Rokubacteria bacterium]|nr:SIP domain-containing protein [Candidatus Rokubacteria bacterium]